MDIVNETKSIDYLAYFTKQLPRDLANLAVLRDEMEKRQGALTAVEDTLRIKNEAILLRQQASDELANAKAEAKAISEEAHGKLAAINQAETSLAARETAIASREKNFADETARRAKELTARETNVVASERDLALREASLADSKARLAADTAALDARIKAFQAKVASLDV